MSKCILKIDLVAVTIAIEFIIFQPQCVAFRIRYPRQEGSSGGERVQWEGSAAVLQLEGEIAAAREKVASR